MPGLTKSISCNGRAGSCDLLEASGQSDDHTDVEWTKKPCGNDQQSPSKKTLAALFVRKRLDLARQASPIMSHQSSPSEVLDPNTDKPLHLEAFIKSLGVLSVSSLVLMLSSLLLMCAFSTNDSSTKKSALSSDRCNTH
ncbi:hypothetical protein ElyMa_000966300 [Elysia marginata]|uniref:Uncharacterized protein n=1 Tax=Elysia marginata TaxID=1093978 RepID=A0AAV4HET1_9GAST|nr:hypothetical protein ElyMa_000966300 [Elysia marginata]